MRALPKTRIYEADVISAEGGMPFNAKRVNGQLIPTYEPVRYGAESPLKIKQIMPPVPGAYPLIYCEDGGLYFADSNFSFAGAVLDGDRLYYVHERADGELYRYVVGRKACLKYSSNFHSATACKVMTFGGIGRHGRVFAVDHFSNYKIVWTGENYMDDIKNDKNIGWVGLNPDEGAILFLTDLDDKILAVREGGFTLFTGYGTAENFRLEYVHIRTPLINGNSVAVTGGKAYYFTDEGMYFFNKTDIVRVDCPLAVYLTDITGATAFNGVYYASGYHKRLGRKVIFAYDTATGNAHYIDCEAQGFCVWDSVYFYNGKKIYKLANGECYSFESGNIDFGTKGRKCLTRIEVDGESPLSITIIADGRERDYSTGSTLYPALNGKNFRFRIHGAGKLYYFRAYAEAVE